MNISRWAANKFYHVFAWNSLTVFANELKRHWDILAAHIVLKVSRSTLLVDYKYTFKLLLLQYFYNTLGKNLLITKLVH